MVSGLWVSMKIRIKSNKLVAINNVLLIVLFCCLSLTSCTCAKSSLSDLDAKGARIPRVALAPMQVQSRQESYFPNKEIIQEASNYLLVKNFQASALWLSSPQFLRKHNRAPIYQLWHSSNLQGSRLLLPHDFIILPEIKSFELKRYSEKEASSSLVQGIVHPKPFYYDVQVYIRIIDMTGPEPALAMQEHCQWEIPISLPQAQSDEAIEQWRSKNFDRTGLACALLQVCHDMTKRCEARIDAAWVKRLPFSRLAKSSS